MFATICGHVTNDEDTGRQYARAQDRVAAREEGSEVQAAILPPTQPDPKERTAVSTQVG